MSILNQLDTSVEAEDKDTLGRGGVLSSNIYNMIIVMAYLNQSKGGAHCVHLEVKDADGNQHRQDIYFTNRNGENFYTRDGQRNSLPGFNQLNSLSLLACDLPLNQLTSEEKVVNVYDFDEKKEVPVSKDVLMQWINKPIKLGILKILDDKNEKNGDGKYVPSGEVREINEIDKSFRASDGMTTTEIAAEATEAVFINDWLDKWKDEVKTKAKGKRDPSLGASTAAPAGTGAPTPQSLFDK